MSKIGFLMMLTPAQRRALQILAALEGKTMADYSRGEIQAAWEKHFPGKPLGQPTDKRQIDNKHGHTEKDE